MGKTKQFLICWLVLGIGLAVCGYGVFNAVGVADIVIHGERAEAVVTESVRKEVVHRSGRHSHRSVRYDITVVYQDAQGATHTAQPSIHDDSRRRKGETVSILYKPDAPDEVMLEDWTSMSAPTLFPIIFGAVFVAVGIALFRDYRGSAREYAATPRRVHTKAGMCIPAYWVRETREIAGMRFRLHGSSSASMEEARERMQSRAELQTAFHEKGRIKLAAFKHRLSQLGKQEKEDAYAVEIFEPILETLGAQSVVTRNRYGAEVLNTTELCFIDIDAYPCRGLQLLLGASLSAEQRLLRDLRTLCHKEADLGIRAYRTAGGWRLIVSGEGLAPASPRMLQLCKHLQADEAYVNLCGKQQCWRARLTPKPGRLGSLGKYPRREASDTPAAGEGEWLLRYEEKRQPFAVCRLLATCGHECNHPLVAWHDERTGASKTDWPLA